MESSTSMPGSKPGITPFSRHAPIPSPPSKLKAYGFAIAIIVGIGGIAVGAAGAAGAAGYFHVGALSNMAQVNAIIMMAAGGGGGTILLIIGVVGTLKNRQSSSHQRRNMDEDSKVSGADEDSKVSGADEDSKVSGADEDSEVNGAASQSSSTQPLEIIGSIDTKNGSVFGPETWKIWGVEVIDSIPEAPRVDLSKNDKVLLYIPQEITVSGIKQALTLKALKQISGGPFHYFNTSVEEKLNDHTAGWVLIDKDVIPDSQNKSYESQKEMVEKETGCSMPSVLEAVVLNLMIFAFTEKRLYGENTYIRCSKKDTDDKAVVVGGFSSKGLQVYSFRSSFPLDRCGAARVRRNL